MATETRFRKLAMLFIFTAFSFSRSKGTEIEIGASTGRTVSPYLTGMNPIYSHESMETWKDGRKIMDLKTAGVGCFRYPGGHVVSFWDWEFPYHDTYQNFWDPAYIETLTPEKRIELKRENGHRMGLTDYFKVCAEASMEPIVGINMFQGYKYNRLEDSIAKAVRLVEYCRSQNPQVKYYYLDNEAGHRPTQGAHVPVDDYIELIPAYSKAIKAVQPNAQLIVNLIRGGRVGEMIQKSGEHFDIVDNHWYYSNKKWGLFHIKDWRAEEKNRRFEKEVRQFKEGKKKSGRDHIKLAVLEWNLGPATGKEDSDKSTYLTQGLIQADMLMQFINHDVFMAAIWPLTWPTENKGPGGFRSFLDHETGEASSSKHIFRWFSMAGNGTLLNCSNPSAEGIHATAVLRKDGNSILVYVLNKSEKSRKITIILPKPGAVVSAQSFQKGSDAGDAVVINLPSKTTGQSVVFKMTDTSLVFLTIKVK